MNAIDGTTSSFNIRSSDAPPPSLLVIVLDTNPFAWCLLTDTLPLQSVVANLLVFINAHLAISHANRVAVLASHTHSVKWLYPTPESPPTDASGDVVMGDGDDAAAAPADDANKYRPFRLVEQQILANLRSLIDATNPADLPGHTSTLIAGALSTAMTYIAKATLLASPVASSSTLAPTTSSVLPTADAMNATDASSAPDPLSSRILIISVSGDLAAQYIPVMNTIFAAQRSRVAIDVLKLAGDTVLLQQACDATGGVYIAPGVGEAVAGKKGGDDAAVVRSQGILQYLMMGFLPDAAARRWLVLPGAEEVDFRAACFCHRKVVDIGWVCSVCLSIFCEPLADATCLTCGSKLALPANYKVTPAVIPRKKKKKKRLGDGGGTPASGTATPAGGTPMR